MNTYITVVKLFFVNGMYESEIAEFMKDELKEYEHQHHEHKIKYTNPLDAVNTILECERKSHQLAKSFEI